MSDHCIECGKTVNPDECSVSRDDAEPIYTCGNCCHQALEDQFHADEANAEIELLHKTVAELHEARIAAAVEGSEWKTRALRAESVVNALRALLAVRLG